MIILEPGSAQAPAPKEFPDLGKGQAGVVNRTAHPKPKSQFDLFIHGSLAYPILMST
jgi:hypothetical protein